VDRLRKGNRLTGADRARFAADLKKRYDSGESIRSIAASTGRSYGFVYRILTENGVALRGRGGATRGKIGIRRRASEAGAVDPVGTRPQIPVQVYVEDATAGPAVEASLREFLYELGVEEIREISLVIGSWYRSLTGLLKQAADSDAAAEARRAIEVQLLDRFQAGIDGVTGDAVAKLITALGNTRGAVVQVGSVLLVKVDDTLIVRQLTSREMTHWQQNPGLFRDPDAALAELQRALEAQPPNSSQHSGALTEDR
jgi:hypothetical protein